MSLNEITVTACGEQHVAVFSSFLLSFSHTFRRRLQAMRKMENAAQRMDLHPIAHLTKLTVTTVGVWINVWLSVV
jgi:hypothetical protein